MSDELKEKLRQINTGRTLSDECKKQIGETLKKNYPHGQIAGKIAISNDELNITKYIFEDEFEEYEKQGYRKGRIKKK